MSIAYLKLFTGMHQDALVPIDYPRIIIGGRDDVDIILSDDVLKGKVFTVDVEDKQYRLHTSSESLSWSRTSLIDSGHTFVFYKTDDLVFGFSDDETLLSKINAENLVFSPYSELSFEQSNQLEPSESFDAAKINNTTLPIEQDEYESSYSKEETETDRESHYEYANRESSLDEIDNNEDDSDFFSNKKAWMTGIIMIAVSLFGIGYFSFNIETPTLNKVIPSVACETKFKALFADPSYSQLQFKTNGTTHTIQGYVDTYDELIAIKEKALKLPCANVDQLYSNQQIISSIKNMLPEEFSTLIKVEENDAYGYVLMEGYAKDSAQWKKLKARILQDVNGLISIEDKVATVETHLTHLQQLINKYELNGYVQLKVNVDKIIADMVFNPSMYDKWTKLIANYKASYPVGPELVMDNVNITQLGIAGISQGKMAHIILANGEKYIVGSVLPNGSVLTRVDDDGLVLSTAKGEIKYPVSTLF